MAGHSVFRHAGTEADLFVLPKIITNAQQRTVSQEPQLIRITAAEVRSVAPAIANTFVGSRFSSHREWLLLMTNIKGCFVAC